MPCPLPEPKELCPAPQTSDSWAHGGLHILHECRPTSEREEEGGEDSRLPVGRVGASPRPSRGRHSSSGGEGPVPCPGRTEPFILQAPGGHATGFPPSCWAKWPRGKSTSQPPRAQERCPVSSSPPRIELGQAADDTAPQDLPHRVLFWQLLDGTLERARCPLPLRWLSVASPAASAT